MSVLMHKFPGLGSELFGNKNVLFWFRVATGVLQSRLLHSFKFSTGIITKEEGVKEDALIYIQNIFRESYHHDQ